MVSFLKDKWEKLISKLAGTEKIDAEVRFWKKEIQNYIRWYEGKIQELYGNPVPAAKVNAYTKELSAILTFFETHQKKKYLRDLMLEKNAFENIAIEIKRVLKPGGRFRMHVHYHLKTTTEPIELNDEIFLKHYSWVNGLKKIQESKEKTGTLLTNLQEMYVIWGN